MAFVPTPRSPSRPALTIRFERRGRARQLSLGGTASLLIGAALVLVGIWALAATLYLAFRDDLMSVVMQRQQQWRYAYEDRIAALRMQMDRVTSRQLVDQDGFEGKVQELMARQAQLESRQAVVNAVVNQATQGLASKGTAAKTATSKAPAASAALTVQPVAVSGRPPAAALLPRGVAAFAGGELTVPQTGLPALRGSGAETPSGPALPGAAPGNRAGGPMAFDAPASDNRPSESRPSASTPTGSLPSNPAFAPPSPARDQRAARETGLRLGQLERSLDGFAGWQEASLAALAGSAKAEALRLKGIVAEVGLDTGRFRIQEPRNTDMANEGGPFVPVTTDAADGPFGLALDGLQRSLQEAERLRQAVAAIPLARPLPGDPDVTSSFGTRVDPFTRGVALHTGIDLRDEYGAAVRSTAPGVVISAEWTGGYGNMVEVDHGNGLATRYGHLSAINVSAGERIDAGAVVGRLGSTGRSTGPHLHYETRIDGEPVDPLRFLRVARKLAGG